MMKIAICQINPTMGDFPGNRDKILSFYREAVEKGADLIVFPEMVITGYPPQDLLLESDFVQENVEILEEISKQVTVPAILGFGKNRAHYTIAVLCARMEQLFIPMIKYSFQPTIFLMRTGILPLERRREFLNWS